MAIHAPARHMDHAFADIEQAEAFVRNDSGAQPVIVEVVAATYMVKLP